MTAQDIGYRDVAVTEEGFKVYNGHCEPEGDSYTVGKMWSMLQRALGFSIKKEWVTQAHECGILDNPSMVNNIRMWSQEQMQLAIREASLADSTLATFMRNRAAGIRASNVAWLWNGRFF